MTTPRDECHARCHAAKLALEHAEHENDLAQLRSDLYDAEHHLDRAFAELHHASRVDAVK